MLETVDVGTQNLDLYERSTGAEAIGQLRELAAPLEGARILHINATPCGGGVAEILRLEGDRQEDEAEPGVGLGIQRARHPGRRRGALSSLRHHAQARVVCSSD